MTGTAQTSTDSTRTVSPAGPGRRHVYLCPLRWSDMDAYQHVNNVVYLRYLEEARVDWMFRRAAEAGVEGFATFGTVVAKHEIEYRRPLVYHPRGVDIDLDVGAVQASVGECSGGRGVTGLFSCVGVALQ